MLIYDDSDIDGDSDWDKWWNSFNAGEVDAGVRRNEMHPD